MTGDIHAVTMPKWGMAMDEGRIVAWHVEAGAAVCPGRELLDVESTKATAAIEATADGVLRRRLAEVGEVRPVGSLLAVIAPPEVGDDAIDAFSASFDLTAAKEEASAGPSAERLSAGGRAINCKVEGEGGTPALLVHGFGGNLDSWSLVQPALALDRRVIAIDLPAHGDSDETLSDGGVDDLAGSVRAVLDALGVDRAHLVGHSMGGAIAIAAAAAAPARFACLVLIAPAGLGPEVDGEFISGFLAAKRRRDLRPAVERLFADKAMVSERMLEDLIRMKRVGGVESALRTIADQFFPAGRQRDMGLRSALAALPLPKRIIWGRADRTIPPAHAEGLADTLFIDEAGHMPQLEAPAKVSRLLRQFLAAVP